ncbi:unnamed protein product [Orchesella dallaii]|uniref:G-protein coupled receptors family 1 profile domain-containing protein n=1 Tax=Orchesella dallaii TaxID=48710 RepID=A0ABP1SA92_9HEXA
MDVYSSLNDENDNSYSSFREYEDSGGEKGCNLTFVLGNCSLNTSASNGGEDGGGRDFLVRVFIGVLLTLIILTTIIGNVFVLAAIWMERNLHSVANYLILSLAVADLMVACLVMPLGAVYEVSETWMLGEWMCVTWTSSDVLSCTASILHLVAIAMDRFWAVTDIDYIHQRSPQRILTMIGIIWFLSLLVSLAQLGFHDENWAENIGNYQCVVNQELGYQIFATLSSFYVPLAVILFLYYRIYQAARKRIRRRRPQLATTLLPRPAAETSLITQASSSNPSPEKTALLNNCGGANNANANKNGTENTNNSSAAPTLGGGEGNNIGVASAVHCSIEASGRGSATMQLIPSGSPNLSTSTAGVTPEATPARKIKSSRESGESKREKKAAKTLAIITGAFIMCWLPFFIMALVASACKECNISKNVMTLILWLGYFNSTLNPVIYTIFSPEFRLAFKKILFGKQHRKSRAVAV